ncbi:MAG: multicopper oxidase family protein [Acidimicrobiales bacterium]
MNRLQWLRATASAGAAAVLPACGRAERARANTPPALAPTDEIVIEQSQWEVRPGLVVPMRTYGGIVPGKILRYHEGQRAVVRVVNRSGEAQTVHWHGLIVPDTVDGTPELGTPPIRPGETQDYEFIVRPSGSRWYHSHMGEGLFSGMYGPLIVEDKDEPARYDREIILMLGAFAHRIPNASSMTDRRPPGSAGLTKPVMSMSGMGMSGMQGMSGSGAMDSMSGSNMGMRDATYAAYGVNGKALSAGDPIRVKRGERIRFRIYNASPTKTFRIALPGHSFDVTHLDGYAVPRPRSTDALELGVAERIDATVTMGSPGVWILGSTVAEERNAGLGIVIAYDGSQGPASWRDDAHDAFRYTDFGRSGAPLPPVARTDLVLRKSPISPDAWSINGKIYPHTAPIDVVEGREYRIRFSNMSMMEHPMHLHGHGFELIAVDGAATSGIIKDTVTVKPMGGTVDVLLRADNPFGGRFLLHCHNEQHMSGGMATVVRYV